MRSRALVCTGEARTPAASGWTCGETVGDNHEEGVTEGNLLKHFARTWDICFLNCLQNHVES